MWVLIVLILAGDATDVRLQEFTTAEKCQNAEATLKAMRRGSMFQTACVEK